MFSDKKIRELRIGLAALTALASTLAGATATHGDDLMYAYEGNVHPRDAGWNAGTCSYPCSESLQDGYFVLTWAEAGGRVGYGRDIAGWPGGPPSPETFWVEWRFRSNHAIGQFFYTCDALFGVNFRSIYESVHMYGDAVLSQSGDEGILGLDLNQFQTYRFESPDGIDFRFSVNGRVFWSGSDTKNGPYVYLGFVGLGGCNSDQFPNMVNQWDHIRYGMLGDGERIVSSDPPNGFLDPNQYAALDRFTVTFDEPNYVYLDDITVEVTGGEAPLVLQTRRGDASGPRTVEIVLDRPLAVGETTRFVFDTGGDPQVVRFTLAHGDADGDGDRDLSDFAQFQDCFQAAPPSTECHAFDFDGDGGIDWADLASWLAAAGPPEAD